MDKIKEILDLLEWTVEKLLDHLNKVYKKKNRDKKRHREYFQKNKKKIYEYHKKYRENHPGYVEKKRLRGKKKDE